MKTLVAFLLGTALIALPSTMMAQEKSGIINVAGASLLLFAPGSMSDERIAAGWCVVQFLTGAWSGALGANSPFLHGLVTALPALALGLLIPSPLPAQLVVVAWFISPAAALIAAALMRLLARRR